MAKQFKLTKNRYEELGNELNYLKTVREKEVAEQIKEARSFGDLSENSEYDEAKNEQGRVFSRIAELENILANAVLISEEDISVDGVVPGARVMIKNLADKSEKQYYVVGSQEANPAAGKVSDESPLGRALIGRLEGDTVSVDAPAGAIKYKILKITK